MRAQLSVRVLSRISHCQPGAVTVPVNENSSRSVSVTVTVPFVATGPTFSTFRRNVVVSPAANSPLWLFVIFRSGTSTVVVTGGVAVAPGDSSVSAM